MSETRLREDENGQVQFDGDSFRKYNQDLDSLSNEPHRMSPTQFLEHPDTLFHSSNKPISKPNLNGLKVPVVPKLGASYGGTSLYTTPQAAFVGENYTHAGSELAALERAHLSNNMDTAMHLVHTPHKDYADRVLTDEEANGDTFDSEYGSDERIEMGDPHDNTPHYYKNAVEDPTSLSAVLPRSRALTHYDYVKKAIDAGKGHEVHPETLRLYNEGKLSSKLETLSPAETKSRYEQMKNPELAISRAHEGGLFPLTKSTIRPTGGVERTAMSEEDYANYTDDGMGTRVLPTTRAMAYVDGERRNAAFRSGVSGVSPRRVEIGIDNERGIGSEWASG
jgi:hypothetical protein